MDNLDQLLALDASIKKWQNVVFKRKITRNCPLCNLNRDQCDNCVITIYTGLPYLNSCCNTSFYSTSVYKKLYQYAPLATTASIQADNCMLSELYEIRRSYIADYWKNKTSQI